MTVSRPVQTSLIEGMDRPVGPILKSVFDGQHNCDLIAAVAPLRRLRPRWAQHLRRQACPSRALLPARVHPRGVGEAMTKHSDEGICQRCGGRNPVWFVDSDRYNMALYRGEIVCPSCFVQAHEEATGMSTMWELRPAVPFRWIDPEGRPTPFVDRSRIRPGEAS